MKVRAIPQGIAELAGSSDVVEILREKAFSVLDAAESMAPYWVVEEADFFVRSGRVRGVAFAQARAHGSGTVHAEYNVQPYMRPALRLAR